MRKRDQASTVIFHGVAISFAEGKWHVDFQEFASLYAAKGYVLRRLYK